MKLERGKFGFRTPDGSEPQIDLGDVVLTARRSASGLVVTQFPAPFDDIEITDGEKLGVKKWARVQEAIAALQGKK